MPLLTKTFQIVAGLLSIPIFGTAIIAGSYASPFVMHLADVVNGSNTIVVASTNAPNWSIGVPLFQVTPPTAATSSTGSLASSTAYSFAIAANDQTGTTTLSTIATQSTDASTSGNPAENVLVTWAAVAGAQRYTVFFATGTISTASGLNQCFYATTTNSYVFSTSTGSFACSYT